MCIVVTKKEKKEKEVSHVVINIYKYTSHGTVLLKEKNTRLIKISSSD
jgi:hypothetical protein